MNLQPDEDLNRLDAKKYGVVGGRNADGLNSPLAQAVAMILQLAPAVQAQVEKFIAKYDQAAAKKATAVFTESELSKEAAEELAKMELAVDALHQAGSIGPYKWWSKFTKGKNWEYQAHHILEEQWFGRWKHLGDHSLSPSVILTDVEHQAISKKLADKVKQAGGPEKMTLDTLWEIYKDVYRKRPEWLAAIKSYFPNAK